MHIDRARERMRIGHPPTPLDDGDATTVIADDDLHRRLRGAPFAERGARSAEIPIRLVEVVNHKVDDRTAGRILVVDPRDIAWVSRNASCPHRWTAPDITLFHRCLDCSVGGDEADDMSDHDEVETSPLRLGDGGRVGEVERDRLLHHDVHSRFEGGHNQFTMRRRRRADVDHRYCGIVEGLPQRS